MLSEGEKQLRGEFSGRFLKQENLEWKKKRAEEGRKRKNGGGLQETSRWREKRRGGNEGWEVRDRRSNAATVEWMAYR